MSAAEQVQAPAPGRRDHRQEVTDSIVRMLEEGVAPWQQPWQAATIPFNPTTERAYRGGNAVHLMAIGLSRGYEDPRWMTYKQAAENGWQVRKGEKGTQIEFWEAKPPRGDAADTTFEKDGNQNPDKQNQRRLIHRIYTVFNAKQIEGVPPFQPHRPTPFEAIQSGERILANSGATIAHDQQDRAFYRPSTDSIHLPPKDAFRDAPGFYGTALHELSHWTGHKSRLNRATLNESYRFGDLNYAKEELRAELASVFIAAEVGVPHDPASHAAYIGSWIKTLKEDKNEIFRAAHDASAAADYVLALEREVSRAEALELEGPSADSNERTQVLEDEKDVLDNSRDELATTERDDYRAGEHEDTRFVARFEENTGTVAMHDKAVGVDHHTPVNGVSSPERNGGSSSRDTDYDRGRDFSSSFSAAKQLANEKLGESARTFVAQTESGNYRGEIIGETDLHVLQRLSPESAVAHMKHLLDRTPALGENVGVGYVNGGGLVKELRERSRVRELAR